MCELCSTDPQQKEMIRQGLESRAEQLERMATLLRSVGNGYIKPHSPEAANVVAPAARSIIRFLVEDWL